MSVYCVKGCDWYSLGATRRRVVSSLVLAVLTAMVLAGCKQEQVQQPPVVQQKEEAVTLCRPANMHLPLLVAEKQGFFLEQALRVTVREFTIGLDALNALRQGDCDLVSAAEPPAVEYVIQGGDVRILGSLQNSDNLVRLVGRADRGIVRAKDLRGKRIATVKGTAPHYFLELFLAQQGMSPQDVTIVFMKSDAVVEVLANGQVDAIAMTNNVVAKAQEVLQSNAVVMEAPGLYRSYILLMTTVGMLEGRSGVAERVLRALVRSEEFITRHPDESIILAQGAQKGSSEEIKKQVGFYQYQLGLDHAMVMGLEETARWMLRQRGEGQQGAPNFLNRIDARPLQAVHPESVRLEK